MRNSGRVIRQKRFRDYIPLIMELVKRDLKLKYRRSFLGYLWSLLNPLLMMVVMTLIFSNLFQSNVLYYPLYLISGQILFSTFSESTTASMTSIIDNASLIKKVYIPKYIFPIAKIVSSFVTMAFSLVAIFIVMIVLRVRLTWRIALILIPIILLFIFCCGVGMILASLTVFFRDMAHLYGVLVLVWMYATPIFYTVDILTPEMRSLIGFNPMYHYIFMFRQFVIYGQPIEINNLIAALISSFASLILGILIFNKAQNKFLFYI